MHIYGHCPAQDDIYLVLCSLCGRVIKPQAFEKHCDRWHGPRSTRCSQPSSSAHQQGPRPGPSLWNLSSSKETTRNGRFHEASSPHTTLPVQQRRTAETHTENSRHEGVNEKTMLHTTVRQSRARTYSRMHKNTDSKSFLSDVCMLQPVDCLCPTVAHWCRFSQQRVNVTWTDFAEFWIKKRRGSHAARSP